MQIQRIAPAGVCACVVILISCGGVREMGTTFQALLNASQEVGKAIGEKNVGIAVTNGKFLTVRLVNSPLNDLSPAEKSVKAFEIARLAYRAYPSRAALQTVTVVFAIQRSYFGVFRYGGSAGSFRVDATRLVESPQASGDPH